jgi:hypothetical protein
MDENQKPINSDFVYSEDGGCMFLQYGNGLTQVFMP